MLRYCHILLVTLIICSPAYSKISKKYVGKDIPKNIPVSSNFIISGTDSLLLNSQLLTVNRDYKFVPQLRQFELFINVSETDTLEVYYIPAPSWLELSYGNALPEISDQSNPALTPLDLEVTSKNDKTSGDIDISGSKSFRVSSATAQSSSFKQTLDLQIAGELSEGVTIKGSISDRGYDPAYGTANSSINELDKVQLELQSKQYSVQLGDIVSHPSVLTGNTYNKKISGVKSTFHTDNYSINAIAARPKGTFTSITVNGQDNLQGPYQITQTNRNVPIVPGSESVYLDGELLISGAENDYIIDYPLGQITFTSQRPIDSRSRIAVDFEPLETEYKKEYYSAESHIYLSDSMLNISFGWSREGDSKSERLLNPFTDEELSFLEQLGDTADSYYISSVKEDTSGLYMLVMDSLPDSVYQYVGSDSGLYSIDFSYVGAGNGEYTFEGVDVYTFVGTGNGDYLPVKTLTTPSRQDFLTTSLRYGNVQKGFLKVGLSQSVYDRNLFSVQSDNKGELFIAELFKPYQDTNLFTAKYQQSDKRFIKMNRQNNSEIYYKMLYPVRNPQREDEKILNADLIHQFTTYFSIENKFQLLEFGSHFNSTSESIKAIINPLSKLSLSFGYQTIDADFDSLDSEYGKSEIISSEMRYRFTQTLSTLLSYEDVHRNSNYYNNESELASDKFTVKFGTKSHNFNYEYYSEDTLDNAFQRETIRNRVNISSEQTFDKFSYKSNIGYQSVKTDSIHTNSFLARLKFDFIDRLKKFNIRTTYHLSREAKQSRGLRYIKVNQGEGNYIFEDSVYIYQENGDYILLEELLSGVSDVKHGEKLFTISKEWEDVKLLFDSRIVEDLFADEKRSGEWIIPFYSDKDKSYLLYNRKYLASLSLFPISSGYAVSFNGVSSYQSRNITNTDRVKENNELEILLRQIYQNFYFDEKVKLFETNSDSYYSINGDVNGYELSSKVSMLVTKNRYGLEVLYRDAELKNSGAAQTLSFILTSNVNIFNGSDLRTSFEYYNSNADNEELLNSYLLTGNKVGESGMLWSVLLQNRLKNSFRLNLRLNGREIQDRESRISVRTEFVAGF